MQITLVDGSTAELEGLDVDQLTELQWEQERGYADRIRHSTRGSSERAQAYADGYDTVTKILACRYQAQGEGFVMGLSPRFARLALKLLDRRRQQGVQDPRFFEIGFGCGLMLEAVAREGFAVAGIEVSQHMREQAESRLPESCHDKLYLGDYLTHRLGGAGDAYDVIYWNDVFEHLPVDENLDYLRRTRDLLKPGGALITITPNWHVRPSDITDFARPPRSEPEGFHLKEYTLGEMASLLKQAGFARVETPLFVTHRHTVLFGTGLCRLKSCCEPLLEYLPFRLTRLLCRGLALSCTIAWKGR